MNSEILSQYKEYKAVSFQAPPFTPPTPLSLQIKEFELQMNQLSDFIEKLQFTSTPSLTPPFEVKSPHSLPFSPNFDTHLNQRLTPSNQPIRNPPQEFEANFRQTPVTRIEKSSSHYEIPSQKYQSSKDLRQPPFEERFTPFAGAPREGFSKDKLSNYDMSSPSFDRMRSVENRFMHSPLTRQDSAHHPNVQFGLFNFRVKT